MNLLRSLQTALTNLRVNKLRSALTMLGVIIGVSAVIIMVAIVEGARAKIVSEFERLGSKLILVVFQPDFSETSRDIQVVQHLTMTDVLAIQEECELVQSLSAEVGGGGQINGRYRDRQTKVNLNGVQPGYSKLRNTTVTQGRFLSDDDTRDWNKVCLIGAKVRTALFPTEDPIGKEITVQGVSLVVVGVLETKGRGMEGGDADKAVLAPITTVQKRILGTDRVDIIFAQPYEAATLAPAMDQIWQCLMRHHDNAKGFRVDSQENILNAIGRILTIFGLVLGSIAGLALLVGGIGVMNIMLVSVTERTREIGIRKAVGAKRKDILLQFLIESATVTGVGGLIGIGLGAGVAWAIGAVTRQVMKSGPMGEPGLAVHLPLWSILGAFGFSAFVGVFFGIYPAIRAAKLDPIQALRHE